jgi:hypothetical protein
MWTDVYAPIVEVRTVRGRRERVEDGGRGRQIAVTQQHNGQTTQQHPLDSNTADDRLSLLPEKHG